MDAVPQATIQAPVMTKFVFFWFLKMIVMFLMSAAIVEFIHGVRETL